MKDYKIAPPINTTDALIEGTLTKELQERCREKFEKLHCVTVRNIFYSDDGGAREEILEWNKQTVQATLERVREIVEGEKWKGEPPESASDITWAGHMTHNQALDDILTKINNI